MAETYVVAIDGPAGSGKSSVARKLAEKLGIIHADSGAIYRTLTFAILIRCSDQNSTVEFLDKFQQMRPEEAGVRIRLQDGRQVNCLGERVLGAEIRTRAVTALIRHVAEDALWREEVNRQLRAFAENASLVIDGRDIGTAVFPQTPYKFYLDASVEVRAQRRLAESTEKIALEDLIREVADRDHSDMNRAVAPLRQAPDAIYIDTSSLDLNAVVLRLLTHLQIQF